VGVIDTVAVAPPRLYRSRDGRFVAGVATGLAAHLGVSPLLVRVVFVVLVGFSGVGILLYAAFWAVLPKSAEGQEPERRRTLVLLLPFAALAAASVVVVAQLGGGGVGAALGWLVALIAIGAGIIWQQTDVGQRRRRGERVPQVPLLAAVLEENDRRAYLVRFIAGGVLVAVGVIGLAAAYAPLGGSSVSSVINGLVFTMLALAGVGLVVAPVLWRTFGALRAEREGRIREQERAEVAAMVHDQVLHTLALIQRNAGDVRAVQRLARSQERELRSWLYKPAASPAEKLAAALEQVAAEVEDAYAIAVEVVVVGDRDTDDRVRALVAAAREALVNAARHAKVAAVSLYAEVEPEQIEAFVRDRGVGFDPDAVAAERHGVRGSIVGRMRRHGGEAVIISAPGEGTEVRLRVPLAANGKDRQ
jgi:signal transduction histidine kinase/phage shock protein PspC (stress-responsive transcriptional regulator)